MKKVTIAITSCTMLAVWVITNASATAKTETTASNEHSTLALLGSMTFSAAGTITPEMQQFVNETATTVSNELEVDPNVVNMAPYETTQDTYHVELLNQISNATGNVFIVFQDSHTTAATAEYIKNNFAGDERSNEMSIIFVASNTPFCVTIPVALTDTVASDPRAIVTAALQAAAEQEPGIYFVAEDATVTTYATATEMVS